MKCVLSFHFNDLFYLTTPRASSKMQANMVERHARV
jgi:hypothetical protein